MAKNKASREAAEILEPLNTNKNILSYLITRNCEKGHNKAYVFVILHKRKKPLFLIRFWGKFDERSLMREKWDDYSQSEHQQLLNEKARDGYKIASDEELIRNKKVYAAIAGYIDEQIKTGLAKR